MLNNANITMDQLQVGLYIHLDLKWFEHPFAFSRFKIKNEEQIKTIRSLGLTTVRYSPALSDFSLPPQSTPQVVLQPPQTKPDLSPMLDAKRAMIPRISQQRHAGERIRTSS